jgi:hypothetical protein
MRRTLDSCGWQRVAVVIALLLLAGSARAQQHAVAPAAAKLYRIAGTIVNASTEEPIVGASITLLGGDPRRRDLRETVISDAEGKFALSPVPEGKYSLQASRLGFMSASFDQHDEYSSAIVTGEGQDTEHILFHLNAEGSVHGHITDDMGEPVEDAQVLVVRRTKRGGLGEHLVRSITATTDDTGEYEVWNLAPGTYLMAVIAKPWYAQHPSSGELASATSDEQKQNVEALDVAYPVTYFDGATEEGSASPIEIGSGERVEANVVLHAAPAVRMSLHVASGPLNRLMRPVLRQTIFGQAFGEGAAEGNDESTAEFTGVAPGKHEVLEGNPPHITEIETTGSRDLDLSSAVPTQSVTLKVRMLDGSEPPDTLSVMLLAEASIDRVFVAKSNGKQAQFDSIPSGTWSVLPTLGKLAVVSVETTAGNQRESRIVVKDRPVAATITLAEGKTNIEGFAFKDGKGTPGVMIVLAPRDPEIGLAQFRRDQSDSDGSFLLRDVVAGDYTVVAIEDGWELDWARPEVIGRYLAHGTQITVTPSSGATMRLSEPVAIQAR